MIAAPWPDREEWQQRHRQAADVMREFQRGSDEVYQAAPKFVPPKFVPPEDGRIGTEDEVPDRDRERKPEQREQQPDDGRTVAAGAGGTQRGEDLEHKAPSYLSGESDLFETDETGVPPVIGDDTER